MVKGYFAFAVVLFVAFALIFAGCSAKPEGGSINPPADSGSLKSFSSWDEVSLFLRSSQYGGYYGGRYMLDGLAIAPMAKAESGTNSQSASEYSQTNVQVQGVDEADIVKNDGKYIYVAARGQRNYGGKYLMPSYYGEESGSVSIIEAYPPQGMKVVSRIEIDGTVSEIFVNKNKMVVFGSTYLTDVPPAPPDRAMCADCVIPPYYSENFGFMRVYDISDRESPKMVKNVETKGSYVESRMIGSKVYAIFSDYANRQYPIPLYRVDGKAVEIMPSDIGYIDMPDSGYSYNVFMELDLADLSEGVGKRIMLMGSSQNIYVSAENIYIASTQYGNYYPQFRTYSEVYGGLFDSQTRAKILEIDSLNMSDWRLDNLKMETVNAFLSAKVYNESARFRLGLDDGSVNALQQELSSKTQLFYDQTQYQSTERTAINKISLDGFAYLGSADVPGHLLNQFSMDESNGYFRVATTQGRLSRSGSSTQNNLYVLGPNLTQVGKIEGIAQGESIYSVRFMGNRAYMVTFKKVDPFFVIDLSDPASPRLLGKLKIPGYSDYLHPYDENYIIGLGKGAEAAEEGDFAWYQGVKLSLFDVRDPANPKEVAKYEIGDRGTDSYALHEHKAFLFSKSKNLLVIPVLLAEIDESKYPNGVEANTFGDYVFQGAYVFGLTPEDGFRLKGTVSHVDDDSLAKSGDYYWSGSNVLRSLYMDDTLYTVSSNYVKANSLSTLGEISMVQLGRGTSAS